MWENSQNVCPHGAFIKKKKSSYFPCLLVCWLHRRWSIERRRHIMDFGHASGCVGPYLYAPSTSARVQSRFDFVKLARDMSSNFTRGIWDYLQVGSVVPAAWYQRFEKLWYLQGTRAPPVCATYWYHVCMNIHFFTPGARCFCCCWYRRCWCGKDGKKKLRSKARVPVIIYKQST